MVSAVHYVRAQADAAEGAYTFCRLVPLRDRPLYTTRLGGVTCRKCLAKIKAAPAR